jgi:hypothetical protein
MAEIGPTIDDLVPARSAAMAPGFGVVAGRLILTTIDDRGAMTRLVLSADQAAALVGDVARWIGEQERR